MDFFAGRRETITDVCVGDLVTVRLEPVSGKLDFGKDGLLPHLIYKPTYAGLDITENRRKYLHGDDNLTPEWFVDIGSIWIPLAGLLAIGGGGGDARYRVFYTVEHCRPDPGLEHTLSYFRTKSLIPRPRGAAYVRVGGGVTVRLSSAGHNALVAMTPAGQRYPLGFATSVQPLTVASLFFGIVL